MREAALVRGSPLFRTLLLAGGLLLVGWGMLHFADTADADLPNEPTGAHEAARISRTGFALKLSSPAASVDLRNRAGLTLFHGNASEPLVGMVALDESDPAIFIHVQWASAPPAGMNHFAKLSLEPSGKPTLVRYFETAGDLDDVWELPAE
ncbi:hypothetical protein KBB96_06575 [Luteolibacter ambystomatis]|uniref:Uncharacterized protein n=1 Tax=Luteolibacter ambystomatis TaxID=2824561 RepID=A0A975PG97_9BACT|nr:hypothetical protein [Luteolibacter ambystomatis]QUE52553.1 hypothetical protein KBB96_06575 [Luteolibacter ambystomatis]